MAVLKVCGAPTAIGANFIPFGLTARFEEKRTSRGTETRELARGAVLDTGEAARASDADGVVQRDGGAKCTTLLQMLGLVLELAQSRLKTLLHQGIGPIRPAHIGTAIWHRTDLCRLLRTP